MALFKLVLFFLARFLLAGIIRDGLEKNSREEPLSGAHSLGLFAIGIAGLGFGGWCFWIAVALWPWWYVSLVIVAIGALPFGMGWAALAAALGVGMSPEFERILGASDDIES